MKIAGFPQAHFDKDTQTGYLVHYYPYDAVKEGVLAYDVWKHESYSPEVLNFKEGRPADLEYFKKSFLELVDHVLKVHGKSSAKIVPVPSSIAHDDPNFKRTPRSKGVKERNRDDRALVFCNLLAASDSRLEVKNVLLRFQSKKEKATWSAKQHAESMKFSSELAPNRTYNGLYILFDDVITAGGTMDGAKLVIQDVFPSVKIAKLAVGLTKPPHDFKPLLG